MSKRSALQEKLEKRRQKRLGMMQTDNGEDDELAVDSTSVAASKGRKAKATADQRSSGTAAGGGAASEEEEAMEMTTVRRPGLQMLDEVQQAETLMKDLTNRRNNKKKELSKTLRSQREDVSAEIRSARQKSRKKIIGDEDAVVAGQEHQQSDEETTVKVGQQKAAALAAAAVPDSEVDGEATAEAPAQSMTLQADQGATKNTFSSTMRERLRNKVLSAKEKAEMEAREETLQPPRRTLRGLRGKPLAATRFDDSLANKENYDMEEKLEKSMDMRNKWKKATQKALGKVHLPSKQEQFDFFVSTFDDEEEDAKRMSTLKAELQFEKSRKMSTVDGAAVDVAKDQSDTTQQAASAVTDGDGDGDHETSPKEKDKEELIPLLEPEGRPFVMVPATYTPNHEKLKQEEQTYYVPSVMSISEKEKFPANLEPRYLEEEGFYVGERPDIPAKNQNKMEHRLINQPDGKGRLWFGEDGKILALPNPVKETPARPLIPESCDPAIETNYRKAVMREFDSRYIDGNFEDRNGRGRYQLDVDINTLKFTHHNLFSREHAISSRLTTLCAQYALRKQRDVVSYLHEKLKALKTAVEHVQESQAKPKTDEAVSHALMEKRKQDYMSELRQTRQQCDMEEKADTELLKSIVHTWKQLKELRLLQGFCNTPLKLKLHRREADLEADEAAWRANTEERVLEAKHEFEEQYNAASERYRKDIAAFKEQRKLKRAALARKRKQERREDSGAADGDEQKLLSDDEALDEPDLVKPTPPQIFDEAAERERVKDVMLKLCLRRPGEPYLTPELVDEAVMTPTSQCPIGEQMRRNSTCNMFVKVLFNGKEVCRTKIRALGQDFVISFGDIFNIQIVEWPQSIMLEVCEDQTLTSTVIADVYAAIPEATVTPDVVTLDEVEFSSDRVVQHSHEGVGSGVPVCLTADGRGQTVLLTSGHLLMSVCWGVDESGVALVPQANSVTYAAMNAVRGLDAVAAIGASAMVDMDKLTKWITESHLDPNDPANADLAYLLRPISGGDGLHIPDYFRLEQLQEEFNFTTDEDIDKDRRLLLLKYREQEIPEFRNYKLVSPFEKDLPPDIFAEYEKRKKLEAAGQRDDGGDNHRATVAKFIQRVREQVMTRFRTAAHQKVLQDMVYEDAVPNIAGIVLNLGVLVEPRRPLRPKRMERKKVAGQNLQDRDVCIMINIVKAYDVPCRVDDSDQLLGASGRGKAPPSQMIVRPYVEAVFQRERRCTAVADGANPSWNEQLQLPFRPPNNDYSSSSLQSVTDSIYLNLFDEVITNVLEDDRQRGKSIHHRIEKKWLGGLQLPFMTLYTNGVIQGTFKVNSPPVLLGYARDSKSIRAQAAAGGTPNSFEIGMGGAENTYLTLYMTVEPPLGISPEIRQQFDSNESEALLQAAYLYATGIEKKFPKRTILTDVIDITGKTVFVTRYIKALKPPDEVLAMVGNAEENVARFVSLIPYVSDEAVFPGLCDIWSTCDQLLQMLSGDEEEHAVLLTNYFLHLGKDAYVCIGSSIPEGPTAFTLTMEADKICLWNAMTGDSYDSRDHFCPLISISCLVNQNNIWANIQVDSVPNRMNFDLKNTKSWQPFFTSSFLKPDLLSVQPDSLVYFPTDQAYIAKQQEHIEIVLKDKFMQEWRPRDITRWNRLCTHAFRTLLPQLELSRGQAVAAEQHTAELDKILGTYKLSGFPINVPFTDVGPIIEAVYATGVWDNDDSNVEFALAVHIHTYPCSVLSVWIYVASLLRKDKAR